MYVSSVSEVAQYSLSSYDTSYFNTRKDLNGKLFIKNTYTNNVLSILDTLPYVATKYSSSIVNELTGSISRFEIAYDTMFIETSNYLVIEKIEFDGKSYKNPKTVTYTLSHGLSAFDKLSNRFKIGSFVYYTKLKTLNNDISPNDFIIYPEIYRFDLINFQNTLLFPVDESLITNEFSVSGSNIRYIESGSPILTHNSKNNLFNVSFILKDQNNFIALHEYDFDYKSNINFISHNIKYPTADQVSNIFNDSFTDTLSVYLSSNMPEILNEELIL